MRIAANRRNALKSTGPRTPAGKAWSRLNALRHGHRSVAGRNLWRILETERVQNWRETIQRVLTPQEANHRVFSDWINLVCGVPLEALWSMPRRRRTLREIRRARIEKYTREANKSFIVRGGKKLSHHLYDS